MRMFTNLIIFGFILFQWDTNAGLREALNHPTKEGKYVGMVDYLTSEGLYFTAVPYIKEYLASTNSSYNMQMDGLIDRTISEVGVRQIEVMTADILARSNAPIIRYIMAKKLFRFEKYRETLQELNGTIPGDHPSKPFALFLEGSAFSISKKHKSAVASYKACVDRSEDAIGDTRNKIRIRQLTINRDYCLAGIARTQFAGKAHKAASETYQKIDKRSYIWPELLFEEAWNSFYLRDFNRSLGKLATYEAPLLNFIFNPEIEVLRALTFLELCQWGDAKKTVDDFYNKYEREAMALKGFLKQYGRNYKYYYQMVRSMKSGKEAGSGLMNKIMGNVSKDPAVDEMIEAFDKAKTELAKVRAMNIEKIKPLLINNLRDTLLLQRDLIGAYVRKSIMINRDLLVKSFEGMSYVKLEVLGRSKAYLYKDKKPDRFRGDVNNIQRTDKQMFWTFNGEFWADELGDYVFSLKSRCKNES